MDTSQTRAFQYEKLNLFMLLAGNMIIFILFSIAYFSHSSENDPQYILDLIITIASATISAIILYRIIAFRGDVITISPDGFHDVRVSALMIPWKAIDVISTSTVRGITAGIELTVSPAAKSVAGVTRVAQLRSRPGRLFIDSRTLEISHNDLLLCMNAYAAAEKQRLGTHRD